MTEKVLFLGDSLGLPRPDRQVVDNQTWPSLISESFSSDGLQFYSYFVGGAHSGKLLSLRKRGYLAGFDPDIVVLQVGIVDCANRALREGTREFISTIPGIRRIVRGFIRLFHRQILSIRNITFVSRKRFESNLIELEGMFPESRFIVIPILPASEEYCKKMPRIGNNVSDYNEILNEVFGESFLNSLYSDNSIEDLVLDDFHHLSAMGHKIVAEAVSKELSKFL